MCDDGYRENRHHECEDIDECKEYGSCSQNCVNTPGSFECSCQSGYVREEDTQQCKAWGGGVKLFYSRKHAV